MRTICQISAVFQLMDSGTKEPATGAAILVDGRRVRHIAKRDGTYVFSNLPATPHTYEIAAPGYCKEQIRLPAMPVRFPEVVLLRHAPGDARLRRMSHFRLRLLEEGAPVANVPFRVVLLTPVGGLRVVEAAEAGQDTLALAGSVSSGMLYQQYAFSESGGGTLLITGFDRNSGRYELADPLAAPLRSGAMLRPVWDLTTDRDGVAILPAIGLFLQREQAEFSFVQGGREQRLVTAPPSPCLDLNICF